MSGVVTAQYIIGSNSGLTRAQLDEIMRILNIRDADGALIQPPVGANCNYKLVLEKADQRPPT